MQPLGLCDFCLSPLEVSYDYKAMARVLSREKLAGGPLSMWRYRDMLPVEGKDNTIALAARGGALKQQLKQLGDRAQQLGEETGIEFSVFLKQLKKHNRWLAF